MSAQTATASILGGRHGGAGAVRATLLAAVSLGVAGLLIAYPPGWIGLIAVAGASLLVATWHRPVLGIGGLLALTVFFEEFEFAPFRPLSHLVPFFDRLSNFTSFGSLVISPMEVCLLAISTLVVIRALRDRQWTLSGPTVTPMLVLGTCLVVWAVYGMLSGGSASVVAWELRGFAYLIALSVVVPAAIRSAADIRLILWVAIAAVAVKAVQGVWAYFVILGGKMGSVQAVTAHEDALFMGWMLVLLVGMAFYGVFPGHRRALLFSTPLLLLAFVATDRRAAYVATIVGLMVSAAFFATDRAKAQLLKRVVLPAALVGVAILAVAMVSPNALGRPGRAIASIVNPTTTEDSQSNAYRRVEETNLIITIHGSPFVGLGFGRPFEAPAQMSKIDFSLAQYIPHNEIMWVWAKMGTLGFAVFWAIIGLLIGHAGVTFRQARLPETKVLTAFVASAIVMQLIVSYVDLQLTFARNMVFLGVLIGILARLAPLEGEVSRAAE